MVTDVWRSAPPHPVFAALQRIDVRSNWYEVYCVAPATYAICEPKQFEEVFAFVLLGDDRALLVDTGMGLEPIQPIVRQLTQLPVTVLNTHTHFDHIGGNWEFERVLCFDTPQARAQQAGGERELWAEQLQPKYLRGALPADVNPATHVTCPFAFSGFVRDGDVLALGGRAVEVIHAPGHSSDSIALFDRGHRLLLTADTFYEGPIYLNMRDSSLPDFAHTAHRLAALAPDVDWLLPSHNAPRSSPAFLAALAAAAEQAQRETQTGANPVNPTRNQYPDTMAEGAFREVAFDGFALWVKNLTA
jgi:glyoxylase-like metal-dependent hydrolase (beta-lactamase superfamily II)